ncbi:type II toxin-antitoxin system VapC family toxin [Demequina sp.]|uniref:type II toxin-antitoxin system VapC family toxin n=1 Tax=Demequina sp. TaxID=2050685 RepID=UPI003A8A109A
MILDSSAVIAIALREPSRPALLAAMSSARTLAVSAATIVEIHAVLFRRGQAALVRRIDRLLAEFEVTIVEFDAAQSTIASHAYRDFGRGSGSPANLNLGDCYSYALATARDEPLLFVGDDFTHTDVLVALKA